MSTTYRFRLQPILEQRRRREELARREFAQALSALTRQEEAAVAAEQIAASQEAGLRLMSSETNELWRLRSGHDAMVAARRRAAHERAACEQHDLAASARRGDLVKASQDREALTQLERTQHSRHLTEIRRIEAAMLDEIAVALHVSELSAGEVPAEAGHGGGGDEAVPIHDDPIIRDIVIAEAQKASAQELTTEKGRAMLKKHIKKRVNKETHTHITDVCWTEFAVQ